MKQFFTFSFLLFFLYGLQAQNLSPQQYSSRLRSSDRNVKSVNFNGQWRGGFKENSYNYSGLGGNNITYVLELTTEGSRVFGYSYTYFIEGKGSAHISDKWGNSVLKMELPNEWNGTNSSGTVPPGVYFVHLNDGEKIIKITVVY